MELKVDFEKYPDGLVPAIVQDDLDGRVLMLGYMNRDALQRTLKTGRVTFFSRSRQQLWTKGETSGNYLELVSLAVDCDQDALLVRVLPSGPVCHTGAETCFSATDEGPLLKRLEGIIAQRQNERPEGSYVASLFQKGRPKIAQKVGEEAVELVIEAMGNDDERLLEEAADLLFHVLVLLHAKGRGLRDALAVLRKREKPASVG